MRAGSMIGLLVLILIAAGVGAYLTGMLPGSSEPQAAVSVSPEAASDAEAKLALLASSEREARLSSEEVTSLLTYRSEIWSLPYLREPRVRMSGDSVTLSGSVPMDELPPQTELGQFRFLLPDTTDVVVAGTLTAAPPGAVTFQIATIEIAGMPIPSRLFPEILERLGTDANLPPGAIALPLPNAASSARLEDGELVLTP